MNSNLYTVFSEIHLICFYSNQMEKCVPKSDWTPEFVLQMSCSIQITHIRIGDCEICARRSRCNRNLNKYKIEKQKHKTKSSFQLSIDKIEKEKTSTKRKQLTMVTCQQIQKPKTKRNCMTEIGNNFHY